MWGKINKNTWRLDTDSLKGTASVKQVEGGYKLFFKVNEKEFGMQLRKREEFFQSKKEALKQLKKEKEQF